MADLQGYSQQTSTDHPGTLPFQPRPVGLLVIDVPGAEVTRSVITREWRQGDAERCRLCPREKCYFTARGTCTVVAPCVVAPGSAALYRLPG